MPSISTPLTANDALDLLQKMDDIIPDCHDGSYERVRKTMEFFIANNIQALTFDDANLILYMAQINSVSTLQNRIKFSSLSSYSKGFLTALVQDMEKFRQYYTNICSNMSHVGMFASMPKSLSVHGNTKTIENLFDALKEIYSYRDPDPDPLYDRLGSIIGQGIPGVRPGLFSEFAHCLKPGFFPIVNGRVYENIRNVFGQYDFPRSIDFPAYFDLCKKLNAYRNSNCKFTNYRCLDVIVQLMEDRNNVLKPLVKINNVQVL